jgi:hypothetical protein
MLEVSIFQTLQNHMADIDFSLVLNWCSGNRSRN